MIYLYIYLAGYLISLIATVMRFSKDEPFDMDDGTRVAIVLLIWPFLWIGLSIERVSEWLYERGQRDEE